MARSTDTFFLNDDVISKPGKGANEFVSPTSSFPGLPPHFRTVLSLGAPAQVDIKLQPVPQTTFQMDGLRFPTVTHAMLAMRFSVVIRDKLGSKAARMFSVNCDGKVDAGWTAEEAELRRDTLMLTKVEHERWDAMRRVVLVQALTARYAQCENAARVLLLTGNAQLMHFGASGAVVKLTTLQHVRTKLLLKTHPAVSD